MTDAHEGARVHNVIGTYLHGSLLPKNPKISDYLIEQAAQRKFGEFTPNTIDDSLVEKRALRLRPAPASLFLAVACTF